MARPPLSPTLRQRIEVAKAHIDQRKRDQADPSTIVTELVRDHRATHTTSPSVNRLRIAGVTASCTWSTDQGLLEAWQRLAMLRLMAVSNRDQGLEVEIVDGRLVISIGIDALMVAVRATPVWEEQEEDERGWSIESVNGFANDILHELLDEEEDGTTLVHIAIDKAVEKAIDQGSLNIDYGDDA